MNRDKVLMHYSQGGKDLRILGNDGYTLFLAGKESVVMPIHENEVNRQFAKAVGLSAEVLAESRLGEFFPKTPSEIPMFVADTSPSLRYNAAIVGGRIRSDQLIVSTADVRKAEGNVKGILSGQIPAEGGYKVEVLAGSLEGQDQALSALASAMSNHSGATAGSARVPVSVIVGHTREGTMSQVLDSCQRDRGALVVGLFCNTSGSAKESQELADRMVEAGAGMAVVPRGFLDSKDAARIVDEMKLGPVRQGENAFQWFRGILKKLGLEEKFGPPTAESKRMGERGRDFLPDFPFPA